MVERYPAVILSCKEFLEARYIAGKGWDPGYLEINNKEVRRVNLVGLLVYVGDEFIVIDDGSGSIYIKTSNAEKIDLPSIGEPVIVIGTPRRHNNYNYVNGEIITRISKKWFEKRKSNEEAVINNEDSSIEPIPEEVVEVFSTETKIKELILSMDNPEGINIQELIIKAKSIGIDEETTEKTIEDLLKKGEIYELKPGFIKPL